MAKTQLVNERVAFHVSQGLNGSGLFRALQTDSALPAFLDEPTVCELTGLSPSALRQRRARRQEPRHTSLSSRCVRYSTAEVFRWLASRAEITEAV
jgi:predicted DNA-binding transcriptional regulator AlpA